MDWTVRLEKLHIDFADKVGIRRQYAAEEEDRKTTNNGPSSGALALANHIRGARAEVAGKLYFNPIKWLAFAKKINPKRPDLGDFIDVKAIRKSWHKLIVQKDDPPAWAYVLVDASRHPEYKIVGWCWGEEAQQEKYKADPVGDREAFFVPQNCGFLKPPPELLQIVRTKLA